MPAYLLCLRASDVSGVHAGQGFQNLLDPPWPPSDNKGTRASQRFIGRRTAPMP